MQDNQNIQKMPFNRNTLKELCLHLYLITKQFRPIEHFQSLRIQTTITIITKIMFSSIFNYFICYLTVRFALNGLLYTENSYDVQIYALKLIK